MLTSCFFSFFFFNDTATTEIYTLSLHDALPIYPYGLERNRDQIELFAAEAFRLGLTHRQDRKSTRLNSSHLVISYAVFCLKKKKKQLICTLHAYIEQRRTQTNSQRSTTSR